MRARVTTACRQSGLPLTVTGERLTDRGASGRGAGPERRRCGRAATGASCARSTSRSSSRGIFSAARQFYVLSTAMSARDTVEFVSAFTESLTQIAAAVRGDS